MGCSTHVVCLDCKTEFYCGSGSYCRASERIERFPEDEHKGHDWFHFSEDWTYVDGRDLYCEPGLTSPATVIAEGYLDFKYVNLSGDSRDDNPDDTRRY